MKHIACSRMWTDVNIRAPLHEISNCCKRIPYDVSEEDIKQNGVDILGNHRQILESRKHVVQTNSLDPNCSSCIKNWPNATWNSFNDWREHDWSDSELAELPDKNLTQFIEIMLEKTCNMSCMYCTANYSSIWEKIRTPGIITTDKDETWKSLILDAIYEYSKNCEYPLKYGFTGGEPFLVPEIFDVLDNILEILDERGIAGNQIRFISNLNLKPKVIENYLQRVRSSKNVKWHLLVSVDTNNPIGEEIRDGLDNKLFEQNLDKVLAEPKLRNVDIINTVTCLSVPYYIETLKWGIEKGINARGLDTFNKHWCVSCNPVIQPEALAPSILPSKYKEILSECIDYIESFNHPEMEQLVVELKMTRGRIGTQRSTKHLEEATRWLEEQGRLKGKDYFEIFPHLKEILA